MHRLLRGWNCVPECPRCIFQVEWAPRDSLHELWNMQVKLQTPFVSHGQHEVQAKLQLTHCHSFGVALLRGSSQVCCAPSPSISFPDPWASGMLAHVKGVYFCRPPIIEGGGWQGGGRRLAWVSVHPHRRQLHGTCPTSCPHL